MYIHAQYKLKRWRYFISFSKYKYINIKEGEEKTRKFILALGADVAYTFLFSNACLPYTTRADFFTF